LFTCPSSAADEPLEPVHEGPPKLDGPPYQLLLLDSPQANAFSYGFGGNGAAGVVVNTGMLDEILNSDPSQTSSSSSSTNNTYSNTTTPQRRSLLSYFLPSTNSNTNNTPFVDRTQPSTEPTEAQTLHLASILAHEMSHLLLSHHLETLSYSSVLLPSAINLVVDLARVVLFPVT